MLKKLWNNEAGFIISAELVLVLTIAVLGMVVGLSHITLALNQELNDVGQAIGALNQSFSFVGYHCCRISHGCYTASVAGSAFSSAHCACTPRKVSTSVAHGGSPFVRSATYTMCYFMTGVTPARHL